MALIFKFRTSAGKTWEGLNKMIIREPLSILDYCRNHSRSQQSAILKFIIKTPQHQSPHKSSKVLTFRAQKKYIIALII